jgi:phospholipase/lecithinase/hemolysin
VLRGEVIQQVNSAIASSLKQFGSKVIYYDVFSFMLDLIANKDAYSITQPTTYNCDGDASDPDDKWTDCVTDGRTSEYFWMSFVSPTTSVHQHIAEDMKGAADKHFGI